MDIDYHSYLGWVSILAAPCELIEDQRSKKADEGISGETQNDRLAHNANVTGHDHCSSSSCRCDDPEKDLLHQLGESVQIGPLIGGKVDEVGELREREDSQVRDQHMYVTSRASFGEDGYRTSIATIA